MSQPVSQSTHWFVHFRGQRLGPYLWDQVSQYYRDCGMPDDFLVWTKSQTDWLRMRDVNSSGEKQESTQAVTEQNSEPLQISSHLKTQDSEGGMRVVDSGGADFSLKLALRDKPVSDRNGQAGVQPTLEIPKNQRSPKPKKEQVVPQDIRRVPAVRHNTVEQKATSEETPSVGPQDSTDEGWLNHAKHQERAEPSGIDLPLTQELNFQSPAVNRSAPIWLTAILALGCTLTFLRHDPGPELPQPKTAFALRCSQVVETKRGASLRKRAKVQVSASKFRVDTPQLEHEFAIFDGRSLTFFTSFRRSKSVKKAYRKETHDLPNPMLVDSLKFWLPQTQGEPVKYSQIAGRSVVELVQNSNAGILQRSIREWIDAKQGVVLKRVETTMDRDSLVEKTTFQCTRAKFGPLPAGTFKEPT